MEKQWFLAKELRGVACKRFSGEGKWPRKPRFVGVGVFCLLIWCEIFVNAPLHDDDDDDDDDDVISSSFFWIHLFVALSKGRM